MSVIPVLNYLEKNNKIERILLTTTTTSSAKIFLKLKLKKTLHKYFPLDDIFIIKKFINHWEPKLAIFIDSEIWPNTMKRLHDEKIPIIILNARITKKSFKNWNYFLSFAKKIFNKISLALPQNIETYKYLKLLGTKNIKIAGNLKFYGERKFKRDNAILKKKFSNRDIWCAASTHDNEEIIIANLHKKIKKNKKNLLTIIIPRHIKRSRNIILKLKEIGLQVITHSSKNKIKKNTDIYLVDSYGEAKNFYDLTNVTFVGGSIINHGGQNPLEPARSGNFIVNGPNIHNFTDVYNFLKKHNLSITTSSIQNMNNIILKKLNYKISSANKKKIYTIGNKILNKNLFFINKFLK